MSANILPLNMPNITGIPVLKKTESKLNVIGSFVANTVVQEGLYYLRRYLTNQWGLFDADTKKEICTFNNFVSLQFKQQSNVPTAPIENDGFKSYNKINSPYTLTVTITRTGSTLLRQLFLTSLEEVLNNTKSIRVVTPEVTYPITQVTGISYKRDTTTGKLLTLELTLQEIRVTAITLSGNTKNDSGKAIKDHGQIQPTLKMVNSLPNGLQEVLSKFGGLPL